MGVRPMVNWNYRILGPPPPLPAHLSHFGKNFYRPQTLPYGSWTYQKPVCGPMQKPACGPIGDRFVDLLETGLWTYRKPVRGSIGNWFVKLSETGLWTYRKPVCARRQPHFT